MLGNDNKMLKNAYFCVQGKDPRMKNDFKSIYAAVKSRIENFEIAPGELLPSETELAQEFGVSRPTVTKVYNQLQEDGLVVKKRGFGTEVLKHKGNSLPLYGLLLPGAGESEIFGVINDKLMEMASPNTYACLCEGAGASNAKIRSYLLESCTDEYISKRVDGVIFSPLERVDDADALNRTVCRKLDEAGIPVVLVDRDIYNFPQRSDYDLVCLDNYSAGFLMAEHFIGQGHKNIYFFHRPFSAYSVQLRISGVSSAMRQAGLEFSARDVICAETSDFSVLKPGLFEPGAAIICANDSTAAMLIPSLESIGYEIGKNIFVSGYDNMRYARQLKYPLTSFRQPCEKIAELAVELMARRIANPSAAVVTVNLTGELIVRESSVKKQ